MIILERKDRLRNPGQVGKKVNSAGKMQVTRIPDCTDIVWKTRGEAKILQEIIWRLQGGSQSRHNSTFLTTVTV